MPQYDEQINPQGSAGSTVKKAVGQMAVTMGMFLGAQVLTMAGYSKAKGAAFKAFSKIPNPSRKLTAALSYANRRGGSLTSFAAKYAKAGSGIQRAAAFIDDAAFHSGTVAKEAAWASNKYTVSQKFNSFKRMGRSSQVDMLKTWSARYVKREAAIFPIFYGLEQKVGILQKGPEEKKNPKWWNLPAHAVGMAKYLPQYLIGDLVFRGGGTIAKAVSGNVGKTLTKHVPSGVSDAIAQATNYLQNKSYRNLRLAGTNIGTHLDRMSASKTAFVDAIIERPRMFNANRKTISKYERTGNSFTDVIRAIQKRYHTRYDAIQKKQQASILAERRAVGDWGASKVMEDFSDMFSAFEEVAKKPNAEVINDLYKHYSYRADSNKNIHRLTGTRYAMGSDYTPEAKLKLGKVYDNMVTIAGDKGALNGIDKYTFIDSLVSETALKNINTGLRIDSRPLGMKYWANKVAHSKPMILGGKFSLADLFPIKPLTAPELGRAVAIDGPIALDKSKLKGPLEGYRIPIDREGNALQVNNAFIVPKNSFLLRRTGDTGHKLYVADRNSGLQVMSDKVRLHLNSDSDKLTNVHIKGLIRTPDIEKALRRPNNFSDRPVMGWIQEKLGLFDGKGGGSIISRLRFLLSDATNAELTPGLMGPYSLHRAKTVVKEAQNITQRGYLNDTPKVTVDSIQNIRGNLLSLGKKMSDKSNKVITSTESMNTVVDFLKRTGRIDAGLKGDPADPEFILTLSKNIINDYKLRVGRGDQSVAPFGRYTHAAEEILKTHSLRNGNIQTLGVGISGRAPLDKLKRFIYEYVVHSSQDLKENLGQDILNTARKRFSKKEIAQLEVGMFYDDLQHALHGKRTVRSGRVPRRGEYIEGESILTTDEMFLEKLGNIIGRQSSIDEGNVLEALNHQLTDLDTVWGHHTQYDVEKLVDITSDIKRNNPFSLYSTDATSTTALAGGWIIKTVNDLIGHTGLGWDPKRFSTGKEIAGLWGRRTAAFMGLSVGYSLLDTIIDTSGLFDSTFLDEGITVGVADQAVRARMASGWLYDKLGVDDLSRKMEGLMPGSSKVIPGAAIGFAMGGIPGAAIGATANAYLQPQMQEGALGFLSVIPGLNFLVTDPTLDFNDLQAIYSGKKDMPRRKGKGWSLGGTPIAGGRIERYEPNWYPRLKAQTKAGPALYGSRVEQFLAKDLPFLDFSFMDVIDPHYLEYKHYEDRPFPIPSTPFSEVPFIGPILGATVGQAYNAIHPLGQTKPMHMEAARNAYMEGSTTDWRGTSQATYGPQYSGYLGSSNAPNTLPGNTGSKYEVMSPHALKPLIGEQVYKGFIEPAGLPGFTTSALLWGGDEPFTHIPLAQSANIMDSTARSYWDTNLGDLVGTTELLRRAIPRPRTSYESVNQIRNNMPSWMPESFKTGDPYCLHPDTLVETSAGLLPASHIQPGMLLKTLRGVFAPAEKVVARHVDEDIYEITLEGLESLPLKTTGGHPFYVDGKWKFAKDLHNLDHTFYPLVSTSLENKKLKISNTSIKLTGESAQQLGLVSRWTIVSNDTITYIKSTPDSIKQETKNTLRLFKKDPEAIELLQNVGLPLALQLSDFYVLLNYLNAFLVNSETSKKGVVFRFHTEEAAYSAWQALMHNNLATYVIGRSVVAVGAPGSTLSFELGTEYVTSGGCPTTFFNYNERLYKHGPHARIKVNKVTKQKYTGLVYTIDMGESETYTLPGAVVHNSKVAHGELLLPGKGYENFYNPKIDFPVGMSGLGHTPYEQALHMVGLNDFTMEEQDILDKGNVIHKMVQNQLLAAGLAVETEALISEPEQRLYSYVDVLYRDPNTKEKLPLEIKSIGRRGFAGLDQPKWANKIQLNSYMATMGVSQGKFLYIMREDPTQTKEFTVRFNPELWEKTKSDLAHARSIAKQFLEQGYGTAVGRYSYIDRLRILGNAAPYSKEYRETEQLLKEQAGSGYLTPDEEEQFSELQKQHKNILRKYEMYPRRFELSALFNPSREYQEDLSSNENIKPASHYNLAERVIGSVWEYATHLRSPLHTKLIGAYSPEELYEQNMLRGGFASWTTPVESFIKPWGRGLRAATDPLQGAVSFGTGGAILGGVPGAIGGVIGGAIYGTVHGMYRGVTGTEYIPQSFKERTELQSQFDTIDYTRNLEMFRATGDKKYLSAMRKTPMGWMHGMSTDYQAPQALPDGYYDQGEPQSMGQAARYAYQAYNMLGSPDRGFHSPYGGTDAERALQYDISFYSGYGALPSWDRPFWGAFVEAPKDRQEAILRKVDNNMADMLKVMWGRPEEVAMPSLNRRDKSRLPSFLNPVMDPTTDIDDVQLVTVEQAGLSGNDFGLGWRDQVARMKASNVDVQPLKINDTKRIDTQARTSGQVRDALEKILFRMGYSGATVSVENAPTFTDEAIITVNVKRQAAAEVVENYYG